ncbi:hypothetical protein BGY98DRAFT_1104055 [Russula aff. rugulosa BPL654]|nr:hypothetical protein BGY98DRAFT_1104055 [Russula aff. rugulosa BPL654]
MLSPSQSPSTTSNSRSVSPASAVRSQLLFVASLPALSPASAPAGLLLAWEARLWPLRTASRARSSSVNPTQSSSGDKMSMLMALTPLSASSGDKMSMLMALTRTVSAIWHNACALGIFDRDLWAALDFSWEVILGTMNMVATRASLNDLMHFTLCEQTQMSTTQTAAKLSM